MTAESYWTVQVRASDDGLDSVYHFRHRSHVLESIRTSWSAMPDGTRPTIEETYDVRITATLDGVVVVDAWLVQPGDLLDRPTHF